jgi:hypothetical protein
MRCGSLVEGRRRELRVKREDLRFIEAVSKVCGEVEEVSG